MKVTGNEGHHHLTMCNFMFHTQGDRPIRLPELSNRHMSFCDRQDRPSFGTRSCTTQNVELGFTRGTGPWVRGMGTFEQELSTIDSF